MIQQKTLKVLRSKTKRLTSRVTSKLCLTACSRDSVLALAANLEHMQEWTERGRKLSLKKGAALSFVPVKGKQGELLVGWMPCVMRL